MTTAMGRIAVERFIEGNHQHGIAGSGFGILVRNQVSAIFRLLLWALCDSFGTTRAKFGRPEPGWRISAARSSANCVNGTRFDSAPVPRTSLKKEHGLCRRA